MHTTYILYSQSIDKYYTGSTSGPLKNRIDKHNTKHKGFTNQAQDWKVVYSIEFDSVNGARALEKRIKKNGAKRFLERL